MTPDDKPPRAARRESKSSSRSTTRPRRRKRGAGSRAAGAPSRPAPPLTDDDLYLFGQGTHYRLYDKLGAHPAVRDGVPGFDFAVWAPNAEAVAVVGDFNDWSVDRNPLRPLGQSGIWYDFVARVEPGALYKYHIRSSHDGYRVDKADPFAFRAQVAPDTASVAWDLEFAWGDADWLARRAKRPAASAPMAIYEIHAGSWRRDPDAPSGLPSYRQLSEELIPYLERMQFTHVEFLPLMEHPFYGSWGYQTTSYFAPTSRYGVPQELMQLIDTLHRHGFGVILDWVPSHFPGDEHGIAFFDGTHLFEHFDRRQGHHPDWDSSIFNYGRHEVASFLISSALFWIERYHADALRVDAVASMLYLDYSREQGEWVANRYGGRENLEAIDFLRQLNRAVHEHHADVITIAEESTSWPMVSRPEHVGGLGFDMKWDMGWMHDTLQYMSRDSVHRKYHQHDLTFRSVYSFSENFVLPLSHDEVVHGKGSLIGRMSGDYWQKFANLRVLLGYMYAQPGKKLLFMGGEIGQWQEWNHDTGVDWQLLDYPSHVGLQQWVADLNRTYREQPALHETDFEPSGFRWIDCSDADHSVIALSRNPTSAADSVVAVFNFTPLPRVHYRIGVPAPGVWCELLNSDATEYGGSGMGNCGAVEAVPIAFHGMAHSVSLVLPPLAALFLSHEGERPLPDSLVGCGPPPAR
jgi:1,4-alpha-glucan branching enzyme